MAVFFLHGLFEFLSMVERYGHQNGAHIESAMDRLAERYLKLG